MSYSVEPWPGDSAPPRDEVEAIFSREGLAPRAWSNGPGDRYSSHTHSYYKVLYCMEGTITFNVQDEEVELAAGDRLEIPPGTSHSATVGPHGVTCIEAARY